jgi:hypothetical protein
MMKQPIVTAVRKGSDLFGNLIIQTMGRFTYAQIVNINYWVLAVPGAK